MSPIDLKTMSHLICIVEGKILICIVNHVITCKDQESFGARRITILDFNMVFEFIIIYQFNGLGRDFFNFWIIEQVFISVMEIRDLNFYKNLIINIKIYQLNLLLYIKDFTEYGSIMCFILHKKLYLNRYGQAVFYSSIRLQI